MRYSDETEADLKALIERDLGSLSADVDLRLALLDWLHLQGRQIPVRPRRVALSDTLKGKAARYPAIANIILELSSGGDLTPWLSERVRKRKGDFKADLMFNDWQISHFHLGTVFDRHRRVKRTGDLLFAYLNADRAVLLDVQPHGSWSMVELIRVLVRTSPQDVPELKGILGTQGGGYTDDQIFELRRNGLNAPLQIDGKVYMAPGLGIASSGHASRITHLAGAILRALVDTRRALETNTLPRHHMVQLANTIGLPVRLGLRLEAGSLIIYEKTRGLDLTIFRAVQ